MKDSPESQTHLEERCWERGWDGHERMQRRRLALLPLPDKLLWLEQAQRVVMHLQASRSAPAGSSDTQRD